MKPAIGVCYFPEHWPEEMWAKDAQEMVDGMNMSVLQNFLGRLLNLLHICLTGNGLTKPLRRWVLQA